VSRKKRQKKPRGKATARNQRREKWELPILYDRRAAMAKVLAEDEPGGTIWVNDHEAGAPVVWHNRVTLKTGETIAYPWPLPSELLLRSAELRLERATHLRVRLLETASDGGELYPEHKTVNNYDLVFEFFQEAMTGVVLVYAALNNFANEHIPQDFSMEWKERNEGRDYFIDRGIELRLSKVLHAATGKPNLKSDRPDLGTKSVI